MAVSVGAGCKEASTGPPIVNVTVANVAVTSSLDTVVAVGSPMTTMSGVARDASNNPVTVTFNWTSGTPAAATVNAASGAVTAVAAGATTITAAQSNNAVTGTLGLRVVDVNLPATAALLADPFSQALRAALSATPQGTANGLVTTCGTAATAGNVVALRTCLTSLINVPGTNGTDNALLAVLDVFAGFARRPLL
jgi:hypothetical protein